VLPLSASPSPVRDGCDSVTTETPISLTAAGVTPALETLKSVFSAGLFSGGPWKLLPQREVTSMTLGTTTFRAFSCGASLGFCFGFRLGS
jgi:hypothetical protein